MHRVTLSPLALNLLTVMSDDGETFTVDAMSRGALIGLVELQRYSLANLIQASPGRFVAVASVAGHEHMTDLHATSAAHAA